MSCPSLLPAAVRVLVVEDDPNLNADLVDFLRLRHFDALGVHSAAQVRYVDARWTPELVLLDIGLPDRSGMALLAELRELHPGVGVVMLTAFNDDAMKVGSLEAGADAYLVKGASLEVIEATCRSVLRRLVSPPAPASGAPDDGPDEGRWTDKAPWRIDVAGNLVTPSRAVVSLTAMEYLFLRTVMHEPGRPVSRSTLLARMGRRDTAANLRNLDGCVARLRRKIDRETGLALPLRSHYGQGYVFGAPFSQTAG